MRASGRSVACYERNSRDALPLSRPIVMMSLPAIFKVHFVRAAQPHLHSLTAFFARNDKDEVRRNFNPFPLTADTAALITSAPDAELYILALVEDAVAGMAMLRGRSSGYSVPSFGLIVDLSFRRYGLGRALLNEAIRYADMWGCSVRLSVYTDNDGAIRLYESCGFQEKSRSPCRTEWGDRTRLIMTRAHTPLLS